MTYCKNVLRAPSVTPNRKVHATPEIRKSFLGAKFLFMNPLVLQSGFLV